MADVVSIVALSLTCFHGCVKGIVVLSRAKHYSRDISDVQLRMELLLHQLCTWATEAGLLQDPPTLLISANNAVLVPKILGYLETLLLDMLEMKDRYGIPSLQPTEEVVDGVIDEASLLFSHNPQRRHWTDNLNIAVFLKRKQPWRRLKWVTLDDKKFDSLLDQARDYVDELRKFLEQARQDRMERALELCVRTVILHAGDERELGIIERELQRAKASDTTSAAAKLKQIQLKLDKQESSPKPFTMGHAKFRPVDSMASDNASTIYDPSNDTLKDMKLPMRRLTLGKAARAERFRTLAQYNGATVLLEWKYVTTTNDPIISRRVNQVATFLHNISPTLHSLQCRGYVEDHIAKRYGYIFDLPQGLISTSRRPLSLDNTANRLQQPTPDLRSLRQVLEQTTLPTLNARLSLAVIILENLLNLHTSGWLHKELRSDNIILIRTSHDRSSASSSIDEDLLDQSAYVAGYVYSRIDSPGEATEPLESDLEADLYRHPSSLHSDRQSYRKSLDIFSVGCMLIEIGLWMGLRQVLVKYSPSNTRNQPKSRAKLPSIMERSVSDPILHSTAPPNHSGAGEEVTELDRKAKRPLDLTELKHELLLSHVSKKRSAHGKLGAQSTSSTAADRSLILSSLGAAMGKRYTKIVEEFLAAPDMVKESHADEHEFALDMEMRARDTMKAIAEAM